MHIVVRPRSSQTKTAPLPLDLPDSARLLELKKEIHAAWHLSPVRQRLTLDGSKTVLEGDEKTLKELGLSGKPTVLVKDLGPQIGWRSTFVIEYVGPLIIHPIFYLGGKHIYPMLKHIKPASLNLGNLGTFEHSRAQTLAYALIMLHFGKRELETLFVHRFSKGSMPYWRVFLNSGHYWGLAGLFLAAPLYGPWNGAKAVKGTWRDDDVYLGTFLALWVFAQASNAYTHIKLANLRPKGTTKRQIPHGFGFNLVACPNYLFEILAWLAIVAITQSYSAALFSSVSTFVLFNWANQRHRRYKKEFGKEYTKLKRTALIPYIA